MGCTGYQCNSLAAPPGLAMVARQIGLVTTASTTYNEPYNLARDFATSEMISNHPAGWNVAASWSEHEARNFGLATTLDHETRHALSAGFVEGSGYCGMHGPPLASRALGFSGPL